MNFRFPVAPEAFYLLGTTDYVKVRIKIFVSTLFLNQVELKPFLPSHVNVLGMKRKGLYPLTCTWIKTFTAGTGSQ
jgi:hypothetical protein